MCTREGKTCSVEAIRPATCWGTGAVGSVPPAHATDSRLEPPTTYHSMHELVCSRLSLHARVRCGVKGDMYERYRNCRGMQVRCKVNGDMHVRCRYYRVMHVRNRVSGDMHVRCRNR